MKMRMSIGVDSALSSHNVEIKLTEKVAIKVPLIGSNHVSWITENIINNNREYVLVYQRKEFQNSTDLLNYNMKEKPDPFFK